jgi:hypothetical protein
VIKKIEACGFMIKFISASFSCLLMAASVLQSQTVIPNAGFENWTQFGNYSNPTGWDTPNEELMQIPFFGTIVVTKSTDHHNTGSFSAKLESKHIIVPSLDVPGFMITADFTVNISTLTYTITGGVPINDRPTHLMGYYKYIPKGGDSCLIGIGLFNTSNGIRSTIGHAEFSTKDTISDWTHFSAWIDYDTILTPDTMQVFAFSTAQEDLTPGTVLYVDDLYLDYTVGFDKKDPASGISIFNDAETRRLMVFIDFPHAQSTSVKLVSMCGETVFSLRAETITRDRLQVPYACLSKGVYLIEVLHDGMVMTRKFFLNH